MESGHCYNDAYTFLLNNPTYILVHGIVSGQAELKGLRFGHAWIEFDVSVYDPNTCKYYPRNIYYALGEIYHTVKYTIKEANLQALLSNHTGPWDATISHSLHVGDEQWEILVNKNKII